LRNILITLAAPTTDEQKKILDRAGATPGKGRAIQQLRALKDAELSVDDLNKLFGVQGFVVASGLLRSDEFETFPQQIRERSFGGVDLTAEAIQNIMREDEAQRLRALN